MLLKKIPDKRKLDPSETRQTFNDVNIKLFCCRYWMLEEWEFMDLSVPFWRLYHNTLPGATVVFEDQKIALGQDKVLIIPPHTSFSTQLRSGTSNKTSESVSGRKIERTDSLKCLQEQNKVDHLFIHFSLGFPLDFVRPAVYTVDCNESSSLLLDRIKDSCIAEGSVFSFTDCLLIKHLILQQLASLPAGVWQFGKIDQRIFQTMQDIQRNPLEKVSNEGFAGRVNMAANSFARLFKANTGTSIQQYILKIKIEKACNLMHHSNKSIDEIAADCGFSDRHHFSRVFKKIMNTSPAYYKKHLIMI